MFECIVPGDALPGDASFGSSTRAGISRRYIAFSMTYRKLSGGLQIVDARSLKGRRRMAIDLLVIYFNIARQH